MNSNKIHILLISYVFPPYYGIGGRRWARHADALTQMGYIVHVICAKNPFKKTSLWYDHIKNNPNIILYTLPSLYPKVFVEFNHTFIQKLQYKFWQVILPIVAKGSYYDRTLFWKKPMLRKAYRIIEKNNIKHVICTGGPFSVMYFATLLKEKFKDLFLLNDFRDPWTWGPNWGFPNLERKRMAYEKNLEMLTIKNSDVITAPTEEMVNYLHQHYPEYQNKIIELPHFYDSLELSVPKKETSDKIRLVYYGNIYQDIDNYIELVARVLSENRDKFTFDIYTDKTNHLPFFEKYKATNVRTFLQIPAKELFNKFSQYDYVLILSPSYNKNNISTKFYEIIYSRTPILLFSEKGRASDFLEKNALGIHIDEENFESKMLKLFYHRNFELNSDFDISKYELKEVTKQIALILNKAFN